MDEFELAKRDPHRVFASPGEVLEHKAFNQQQKIEILRSWEYDARELEVAEEENMCGSDLDLLDQIHAALLTLVSDEEDERHSPTKQS